MAFLELGRRKHGIFDVRNWQEAGMAGVVSGEWREVRSKRRRRRRNTSKKAVLFGHKYWDLSPGKYDKPSTKTYK